MGLTLAEAVEGVAATGELVQMRWSQGELGRHESAFMALARMMVVVCIAMLLFEMDGAISRPSRLSRIKVS